MTFTLLLVWRFPKFLDLIRAQVLDRELLIRYQLYFAQAALGSGADASLLGSASAARETINTD